MLIFLPLFFELSLSLSVSLCDLKNTPHTHTHTHILETLETEVLSLIHI